MSAALGLGRAGEGPPVAKGRVLSSRTAVPMAVRSSATTEHGDTATAEDDADEVEDAGKPIKKKRRRRPGEDIYDDVDRAGDEVYDDDPYEGPRRPRKRRWQPAEL